MTPDLIFFLVLGLVSIASALGLLLSRSAVYSALYLVMNFITIAVFYLLLHAPFLAVAQVTVYAGAIMVLFLFVIMLLGNETLKGEDTIAWQRPLAVILGVILLGEITYLLIFQGTGTTLLARAAEGFGSPREIGLTLFNKYLLPFEITSVLLLVGMIGAIVLTRDLKLEDHPPREDEK